jgi:GDP-4-dehydro-6-deoxy-D-mannose reductase
MRVLVTGAAGFTGTHMMQYLSQHEGVSVTGLVRKAAPVISKLENIPRISYTIADLLNRKSLMSVVAEIHPDTIIHLGGLTHGSLDDLLSANVAGTKNILDAGYTTNPDCRILVVSSSAVYGYPGTNPITEATPLQPLSEYGISKKKQETYAFMFHELTGAHLCVARPFNLAGPGQSESFICGKIVNQIHEINLQKKKALELREITSSRDLIDVRDVIRGYWALISHSEFSRDCSGQVFNLGSGNAYTISKIIALLEEITGRSYEVKLPPDPPEVPIPTQQSDNTRITTLTRWKPEIPLKDTLRDMLAAAVNSGIERGIK